MKTIFALLFSLFAMQTVYANKDFCKQLNNATKILMKKDVKSLGKLLRKDDYFGDEYEFPVTIAGARYAYAIAGQSGILTKQFFENDSREKVEPTFDKLLNQLKACGIDLKEDDFGRFISLVNDIYYSLEMFELQYDEATETTYYSVLLTISVRL